MDVSETLTPKSDQLDAVDLLSGSQVFTITKVDVRAGAEQPVAVHLAEFPRVWRPGKNMRRVLAYCWGNDSANWVGKRVELFCDESVMFGGAAVSGTRISRVSGIDGPKSAPVINGKKPGTYKVSPLPDLTPADKLRAEWRTADPERRAAIEVEVAALGQAGDQ